MDGQLSLVYLLPLVYIYISFNMNIKKEGDNFIITIPCWTKRSNPYMEGEDVGEHPTLIGLIYKEKGTEVMGFAEVIDMDYKDKPDQNTGIQYEWFGEDEEFIKKCKELGIDVFRYPICAYCDETIHGCHTIGDKGNKCDDCEKEK